MTLIPLLVLIALACTVASAVGRAPLWVGVTFLCIVALLQVWR